MEFKATWSKYRFINHIDTICHANNENVVKTVDTINFGEQLVNCGFMHVGPSIACAASLPTDGVNLIEDYDVQS